MVALVLVWFTMAGAQLPIIGGGGMDDAFPQPGALGQQPTAEEVVRQLATQVGILMTEMQQMRALQQQIVGNVDAANALASQVHDIYQSVTGMQTRMDNVEQAAAAAISVSAHATPRGDAHAGAGVAGLNQGNPQQSLSKCWKGRARMDINNISNELTVLPRQITNSTKDSMST